MKMLQVFFTHLNSGRGWNIGVSLILLVFLIFTVFFYLSTHLCTIVLVSGLLVTPSELDQYVPSQCTNPSLVAVSLFLLLLL